MDEFLRRAPGAFNGGEEDTRVGLIHADIAWQDDEFEQIIQLQLPKILLAIGNGADEIGLRDGFQGLARVVKWSEVFEAMFKIDAVQYLRQIGISVPESPQRPLERNAAVLGEVHAGVLHLMTDGHEAVYEQVEIHLGSRRAEFWGVHGNEVLR